MGTVHFTAGRDGPGLRSWGALEFVGWHAVVELRLSRPKCLSWRMRSPQGYGFRVTFWAFFFRYWDTEIAGICSFNAVHLYSFGSWGSYSFHLCRPWAGTWKPMWVGGPMLLLCALLQGLKSWDFLSLLSRSPMLIVTPGQGEVAGTQVSKEPAIHLFHKERNPVTRFHIFCPLKMKQKILISFLWEVFSIFLKLIPHSHTHKMSQLLQNRSVAVQPPPLWLGCWWICDFCWLRKSWSRANVCSPVGHPKWCTALGSLTGKGDGESQSAFLKGWETAGTFCSAAAGWQR